MATTMHRAGSPPIARVLHRAMGVTCRITVHARDAHVIAERCVRLVDHYEHLWSRFIPTSDLCRLNAASGSPMWVDPMTVQLLAHMAAGADATGGLYNPTLLPLQLAYGDAASLVDQRSSVIHPEARPFSDLADVKMYRDGRVRLPVGMTLDAGGIAKGFAADLIADEAVRMGADSVCINLGGDLRVSGPAPDGHGWDVEILDPRDLATPIDSICIASGAVATSAVGARRLNGSPISSHILDKRGTASVPGSIGASVLSSTAAWSEIWSKFAILADTTEALGTFNRNGLAAMIVRADGSTLFSDAWADFRP